VDLTRFKLEASAYHRILCDRILQGNIKAYPPIEANAVKIDLHTINQNITAITLEQSLEPQIKNIMRMFEKSADDVKQIMNFEVGKNDIIDDGLEKLQDAAALVIPKPKLLLR